MSEVLHTFSELLSTIILECMPCHRNNLEHVTRNMHRFLLLIAGGDKLKFDGAILAPYFTCTVLEEGSGTRKKTKDGRRTLVYRIASSHLVLTRGIMPSRCAINSSGSTDVLVSISTMSIARTIDIIPEGNMKSLS